MMIRQVSLLRSFADISDSPFDWTPGVHGILAFWMRERVRTSFGNHEVMGQKSMQGIILSLGIHFFQGQICVGLELDMFGSHPNGW